MDEMNLIVVDEIDDAEFMLEWFFDGSTNDDWTDFEVLKDGNIRVKYSFQCDKNVTIADFLSGCEGLIYVEYIGNGEYGVIRQIER